MCATVTLTSGGKASSKTEESEQDVCWLCLDGDSAGSALAAPCACRSMKAHQPCLARWQLTQAGKREERYCRFCEAELPDWRDASAGLPMARPVMIVMHQGVSHQVSVSPGADGAASFQASIRRIFNLDPNDAIQLSFGCRVPGSGQDVTLEGWSAYEAAVHCASVSAGQRVAATQQQPIAAGPAPAAGPAAGASPPGRLRRLFSRGQQA